MKKFIIQVLLLFSFHLIQAQKCNCKDEFNWIKNTFENNDAGYKYVIDKKGSQEYERFNLDIYKKSDTISNIQKCNELLNEWRKFFRNGHLSINTNALEDKNKIEKSFTDWDIVKFNNEEFEKYLEEKSILPFEGIWKTPTYTIGIRKIKDEFVGFIIESKNNNWKQYQIKLRFIIDEKNEVDGKYYMGDHSLLKFNKVKNIGNDYLKIGNDYWKLKNSEVDNVEMKSLLANEPFLAKINSKTLLLRIPSFNERFIKPLDSLIKVNHKLITSTKNLIIDIRNNGGGSDNTFEPIIPIIYTNPIKNIGVEMYSTELNNARYDKLLKSNDFDEATKKEFIKNKEILMNHLGEFVNLNKEKISTNILSKIYKNPISVAILINENNGSTAEQFLLVAKQSKKVKLFGTTTAGVLDISNMNFVNTPSNLFTLGYAISKSFRIPKMAIDDKGIMPDFYIDDSIENYEWLSYVQNILN